MKSLSILLLFSVLFVVAKGQDDYVDISTAIKQRLVTVSASASGQHYNEKGIELVMRNNGNKKIKVLIGYGAMFSPDSTEGQPFVLGEKMIVVLDKSRERKVLLQTYCANAHLHSPFEGDEYSYSGEASDTLKQVLEYMRTHNVSNTLAQNAVWYFTNRSTNSLSSVYDEDNLELVK